MPVTYSFMIVVLLYLVFAYGRLNASIYKPYSSLACIKLKAQRGRLWSPHFLRPRHLHFLFRHKTVSAGAYIINHSLSPRPPSRISILISWRLLTVMFSDMKASFLSLFIVTFGNNSPVFQTLVPIYANISSTRTTISIPTKAIRI